MKKRGPKKPFNKKSSSRRPSAAVVADFVAAALSGDTETVSRALKLYGAAIVNGKSDVSSDTALTAVAWQGSLDMARLLLDNGADLEIKGARGGTPLIWAVESRNPDMVKMLLERGAQLDKRNDDGKTALELAVEDGLPDIAALIENCRLDREKKRADELKRKEEERARALQEQRIEKLKSLPQSKPLPRKKNFNGGRTKHGR